MNIRSRKMAASTFKIYTIEGIDYDAVIAKYRQLCEEGEKEIDANSISVYGGDVRYIQTRKARKPLNDDTRILNKAIYLIHTIAYREATNREENVEGASIQYAILQRVIGEDVYELLKSLQQLGYIEIDGTYIVGTSSKHYKVIGNITTTHSSNHTILKYINKTKELLKDAVLKRMATPDFKALYGDTFAETYIKNLNRFKIKDMKSFDKLVNRQRRIGKIHYYNFIKDSFNDDLKIFSIDSNNRIYHILTSLKRELKQYINIKYSIDCKNSHPLLFNYLIFNSKGISTDLSYLISSILFNIDYSYIYSTSLHHYDIEKLCNVLINNNIDKSIIARFAPDELLYLWKTTTGRFWDDIVKENSGRYKRSVVKKRMFAQVFYSKKEKDALFATQFKRDYPNVYNLIIRWKEPLKHDDLKECLLARNKAVQIEGTALMSSQETALPNVMMDLESEIFREVLKSLYRKRIPAVHIHDAIVIPDTRATVDVEQVESVMRDVYKKHGLHPTFSVDIYN